MKPLSALLLILAAISAACATPTPTPTPRPTQTPTALPPRTPLPDTPTPTLTPTLTLTPTSTPTPLPPISYTLQLKPGPAFEQSPGSAVLTSKGDQTVINLEISTRFVGLVQAAQIQEGFCLASGAVKYSLGKPVDGKSITFIPDSLASLLAGTLSLNLKPAPDAATFIACSGIPKGVIVYFAPGRDEHRAGAALLIAQEGRTEITVQMEPDVLAVVRPVHIYEGACPNVGAVKYPLNNIVDGRSFTSVPFPLADLLRGNTAISVRKSIADANVFVACGAIK